MTPRRRRARPDLDDEVIRRAYVDERDSLAQIGAATGLSLHTVARRLEDMGIPRRRIGERFGTPATPHRDLASVLTAKLYVDQGLNAAEIGKRTGCSSSSVHNSCRRPGYLSDPGPRPSCG